MGELRLRALQLRDVDARAYRAAHAAVRAAQHRLAHDAPLVRIPRPWCSASTGVVAFGICSTIACNRALIAARLLVLGPLGDVGIGCHESGVTGQRSTANRDHRAFWTRALEIVRLERACESMRCRTDSSMSLTCPPSPRRRQRYRSCRAGEQGNGNANFMPGVACAPKLDGALLQVGDSPILVQAEPERDGSRDPGRHAPMTVYARFSLQSGAA